MYECFHCGCRSVIWDSDFDTEDYGYEEGGIVHALHCTKRGAIIEYIILTGDDNEIQEQES